MSKLNVLLAKTDNLASSFKKGFEEYIKYFKGSQTAFKGELKTYETKDGVADDPSMRGNKLVVTTVNEKLEFLEEHSVDYINALFSQERTNASGVAKARLKVEDVDFGELSSLEILRLKSLLESGPMKEMYANIPVRNDDEQWKKTSNEMYGGRDIYESVEVRGTKRSTRKESYILPDPNIDKVDGAKYTPQIASKDITFDLGEYTHQRFSGEYSHKERASILVRLQKLHTACVEALKVSNEVEAVESSVTAEKIFGYLHRGKA